MSNTITAFCVLAEPEKLLYPYVESLRSVSRFVDKIVVNYAAADEFHPHFRQFEKASYDNLLKLQSEIKDRCKLEICFDKQWKFQKEQTYEEIRHILQRSLDSCETKWFFKFDADNVFRKEKSQQIKALFSDDIDCLVFRRATVIKKDKVGVHNSSEDIYAINIVNLKKKNIQYQIGDIKNWCRADIAGSHKLSIVSDENLIPYNYDATFFTKERLIDFWKKTEEAYSFAEKRKNRFENLTDQEVLENHRAYKAIKNNNLLLLKTFEHPEDIKEKILLLNESHWGFSNFAE